VGVSGSNSVKTRGVEYHIPLIMVVLLLLLLPVVPLLVGLLFFIVQVETAVIRYCHFFPNMLI